MAQPSKEGEIISFEGKTYKLMKKLGKGGFGEVYKAEEYSTTKYCEHKERKSKDASFEKHIAVKFIDKRLLKNPKKATSEIKLLKLLNHSNIIKFYDSLESNISIYIFMEYADYGDLHNYIKKQIYVPEKMARFCYKQIINGVKYLHSHRIAHRDLKPQNVLLNEHFDVKIADFGLSKINKPGIELSSICGTCKYMAPEVLNSNIPKYNGCKADMFSLGIILKDLATTYGVKTFSSEDCKALYEKLTNNDPDIRPSSSKVLKDKWLA